MLISGASVAGPVPAWWLHRYGIGVTVVERTPEHRRGTGGHAVDLFEPAVEILDRMRLVPPVEAARTRTDLITIERPGHRPVNVDLGAITSWVSQGRHVEVMRGELAEILYGATAADVEHRFGDSIRAIDDRADGVHVEFEHGSRRRFDLVVGADGLHSVVRRLVFGPDDRYSRHLGGYLAAFTMGNHRGLTGTMVVHPSVDKLVGLYPVWQSGQARAVFLFRCAEPLAFDYRDTTQQRALLRSTFARAGWEVPRLLDAADQADDFYLDTISQIRMDTWPQGRVTLVGDAGYAPGPAVGGGTTLAVVGAFVLAAALADAHGNHPLAYGAYHQQMASYVSRSHDLGPALMRSLVPRSRADVRLLVGFARTVPHLPSWLTRRIAAAQAGPARAIASFRVAPTPVIRQ